MLPAGPFFVPSPAGGPPVPIPAESLNYLFGAISGQLEKLRLNLVAIPFVSWAPEFVTNATVAFATVPIMAIGYDPTSGVYITAQVQSSGTATARVFSSPGLDGGAAGFWTEIGIGGISGVTSNAAFAAVAPSTTAGHYLFAFTDRTGPPNTTYLYLFNGTSWVLKSGATSSGTAYGVQIAQVNGYAICAVADSGAPFFLSSNNEFSTSTSFGTAIGMPAGSDWLLKSSSTQALAIPKAVNLWTVYATTDGHTWSSSSGLGTLLSTGDTVVGLAWGADAQGPCWLAAVNTGSGKPLFARSTDGLAWSLQAGGTVGNFTISEMASDGQTGFVCPLVESVSRGASGQIYSVDGGVTWRTSPATLAGSQASPSPGYITSKVVAGLAGFFTANNITARVSSNAGLTPVV